MGRSRFIAVIMAGLLVVAACSGGDGDDTSTTSSTAPSSTTTTAGGGGTTTTGPPEASSDSVADPTTTSTTLADPGIPEYSIQARIAGEAGDTVVVFVEPATYTDLDIENVVADAVQRFAPITTLHVVDDTDIVDLVLSEEAALTADELASRDAHYFARLEEGFRLVFTGPFGEVPEVILGS